MIQVEGAGFVIKEFYYSGCLTPAGNNYTDDQFIEIYNNSADTLYADSLLIVEHESYGYEPNYWSYMASVITSYSIHYTKLYDLCCSKLE